MCSALKICHLVIINCGFTLDDDIIGKRLGFFVEEGGGNYVVLWFYMASILETYSGGVLSIK